MQKHAKTNTAVKKVCNLFNKINENTVLVSWGLLASVLEMPIHKKNTIGTDHSPILNESPYMDCMNQGQNQPRNLHQKIIIQPNQLLTVTLKQAANS